MNPVDDGCAGCDWPNENPVDAGCAGCDWPNSDVCAGCAGCDWPNSEPVCAGWPNALVPLPNVLPPVPNALPAGFAIEKIAPLRVPELEGERHLVVIRRQ